MEKTKKYVRPNNLGQKARLAIGSIHHGKVRSVYPFGAFVKLDNQDVEGLVFKHDLDSFDLKAYDQVTVIVDRYNKEGRLTLKLQPAKHVLNSAQPSEENKKVTITIKIYKKYRAITILNLLRIFDT